MTTATDRPELDPLDAGVSVPNADQRSGNDVMTREAAADQPAADLAPTPTWPVLDVTHPFQGERNAFGHHDRCSLPRGSVRGRPKAAAGKWSPPRPVVHQRRTIASLCSLSVLLTILVLGVVGML
jgi:hypothetical protein